MAFGCGQQSNSPAAECPALTWNVVTAKHMEAALKPTGDWPGGHSISKDGLWSAVSPTSRKEFRIDPALHGQSRLHRLSTTPKGQTCMDFRMPHVAVRLPLGARIATPLLNVLLHRTALVPL